MIPLVAPSGGGYSVLAIDPGSHTGWAYGSTSEGLLACGLGDGWRSVPYPVGGRAVLEYPQIRPGTPRPNDIVTLAFTAGAIAARLEDRGWPVEKVFPVRWKGTIDKKRHHPRIVGALLPHESRVLSRALQGVAKQDDVIDAVGLFLWATLRPA